VTTADKPEAKGVIVAVYLDSGRLRYVVLVSGRLTDVSAEQLTVVDDPAW
jgi:hypothetical protein